MGAGGTIPSFNAQVQAYGFGIPGDFIQGIGSPSDSFHNIPIGAFWQDSWRISPNVTLNYGLRYDVEIPPSFTPPQGLALPAYNLLGLEKGIKTDKNNIQPRIGLVWIRWAMARRWFERRMGCSTTIRFSACLPSWRRFKTGQAAGSWRSRVERHATLRPRLIARAT